MNKTNKAADEMIPLGKISALFGIKGWVKIHSYTEPRESILNYSTWYLEQYGQWQAIDVLAGKKHGKSVIAHLANCNDRDEAATLVGLRIAVKRQQLPPTEAGEYYWNDLYGLRVSNLEGIELGVIHTMMETGANDVMVVRSTGGAGQRPQERLIPFIQGQVIREIDLDEGWMKVDWDADF